ncbi:MAG: type ISP restriction/modification enzyme, partial [Candidatus Korobacteraceae bacterium]
PQSVIFEEFRREREDSENIKQHGTILVILGNPPYNGYAGIAKIEEERDLTNAYRAPVDGLPAPQGQGLNDLYIRFFRIAERRIAQNENGQGVVCFISNNAWLDGLSHPTMRHHYLRTFEHLFIDNLNGDKYRTGKTTPDGLPDPSAFSTPQNREGIQLGTAISMLVRSGQAIQGNGALELRDLWGTGKLGQLARESRRESEPEYGTLELNAALGNPFARRVHASGYTSWPRLTEIFRVSYPGIKTSRDPLVVDIDRDRLESRMRKYFDVDVSHEEMSAIVPGEMEDGYMYKARLIRELLQRRGFRSWEILRYAYRPFDSRWIHWEPETSLLRRKVEEYVSNVAFPVPAIVSQQIGRGQASAPLVISTVGCIDLLDRSASCFPAELLDTATLLQDGRPKPNLSREAASVSERFGATSREVFFHVAAVMHAPLYRIENAGALLSDWPRIPLPTAADLLTHSAALGRRLAELLDAESAVQFGTEWTFLGALKLPRDSDLTESLKITADWGRRGQGSTVMPAPGRSLRRAWTDEERGKVMRLANARTITLADALTLLGDTCVDVCLNGDSMWSAVPVNVWNYTLGGYQVLKKWLSYREFDLLGRALRADEAAYFAEVVRRIAAILLMSRELDTSYQAILPTAVGLASA